MNVNTSVNFESFYYFELLEKIRKGGEAQYGAEAQKYLGKLLEFLESEDDALVSIENLAGAQSTSDLAIFFSDIIDHVSTVSPEESMGKIDDRVRDFLEIFEVFLQNDEWKEAVEREIFSQLGQESDAKTGQKESAESDAGGAESCEKILNDAIASHAEDLPDDLQHKYINYANVLLQQPDIANLIEMGVDHPETSGFYQTTYVISQMSAADADNMDMSGFQKQADAWAKTFKNIFIDQPFEVSDLFESEVVDEAVEDVAETEPAETEFEETESFETETVETLVSETESVEAPSFESLFEEADNEFAEDAEEEAHFEEKASELDSLVESINNRESRSTHAINDSEEARERRNMLRDYVISELESYSEEISEAVEILVHHPTDADMALQLKDALKALKDLGQIHNYPAIESAADTILRMYAQLQQEKQSFPESEKSAFDKLLSLMRDYVDGVIAGKYEAVEQHIVRSLAEMHGRLFDAEPVSNVYSGDTLEAAFQDVVSRFARQLQAHLEQPQADDAVASVFENLNYWNALLLPDIAGRAVQQMQQFFAPGQLEKLTPEQHQFLADILKSWETSYVTESQEVWQNYNDQLTGLYSELTGTVGIGDAEEAFADVTLRQLDTLEAVLAADDANIASVLDGEFAEFLEIFRENSTLVNRTSLANIATGLQNALDSADIAALSENDVIVDDLRSVIQQIRQSVNQPDEIVDVDEIIAEFGLLVTIVPEENEDTETSSIDDLPDDESIEDIFETEIDEIEESAEAVEDALEDELVDDLEEELEDESDEDIIKTIEAEYAEFETDEELELEDVNKLVGEIEDAEDLKWLEDVDANDETDEIETEAEQPDEAVTEELTGDEATEEFDFADGLDSSNLAEEVENEPSEEDLEEEEMIAVFRMEAFSYLNEMESYLRSLESDISDREVWRGLGVSAHTLRGSAQMIGRSDIVELTDPIDRTIDLAQSGSIPANNELLSILRKMVLLIKDRVNNHEVDSTSVLNELEQFIAANTGITEAQISEYADTEEFVYLREQDPELLSIFQNEVSSNFDVVEKNLTNLEKFTYDKEAVQQIERAVHEIRAAAKMLGISEIGSIADSMETVFEKLAQRQLTDLKQIIPVSRRGMIVIRHLTDNFKVSKALYDETQEQLEHLARQTKSDVAPSVVPDESEESVANASSSIAQALSETPDAATPEAEPFVDDHEESDSEEESPQVSPQVLELYLQEAREQLDDINYLMIKLEKEPQNEELQHHLMRCMHTLKGSSGMVYAHGIEGLSHRSEDILEKHLQEKSELSPELFDLLFEVMDDIQYSIKTLEESGREKTKNFQKLMERLDAYYQEMIGDAEEAEFAAQHVAAIPVVKPVEEVVEVAADDDESVRMVGADELAETPAKDTYLRLNINKMNQLLNLAAESVIGNNQFKNQLDGLKHFINVLNTNMKSFRETEDYLSAIIREERKIHDNLRSGTSSVAAADALKKQIDSLLRALKNVKSLQDELTSVTHSLRENSKTYDENLQKLNKLSNELLDEILQARLVPINLLFQRFHRPIRDLARQLKKQIRLSLRGEETEMDRTLIDELYEPLLHIIRNALDHGLETVDERKAAGKHSEGLLEIKAYRDRNQVIIEVRDDGRGIDLEQIKAKAIQKGLLSEKDADSMTDQELFDYLFYPGFTTATETTLVSGRGVGLDAVKSQIEKAKGDIRMYTEMGRGTTFSIRVPISLSVIQSMLVDVSGHVYSVPLLQVEETLHVSGQDLLKEDGRYFIRYRERKIPVMQLAKLLKLRETDDKLLSAAVSYPVIMVQDEGNRVALLVDKIIRREEILIKSLGPGLRRLKYISGGSIMADGQVVLVLDIPQIIQDIQKGGRAGDEPVAVPQPPPGGRIIEKSAAADGPPRRKKRIEGRKPVALIVDDSLSIRKYISSLLMQKGYITDTARNGYEALELLNKQEFDIMVTDLEMPKLSGYELIETVRYDQRFNQFPIIVLTGRAGENFRQLTQELGADAYIVKPFKDRELFEQLEKFIDFHI
ncbi:MAG: Hpt domain-containing protein [Calditrichia bacterium]